MDYKGGEIAEQIIKLQKEDGTWGNEFHSLAMPTNKAPLTTEQALRRLKYLGFTIADEPIWKSVNCMVSCLRGERKIDDYWEKGRDWELFTKLMLSTWVRIFEPDNEVALEFAKHWTNIIEEAFKSGSYNGESCKMAYAEEFQQTTNVPKEINFVTFYEINLVQGLLSKETESRILDYVISHDRGIYYIYDKPINILPKDFQSIAASRYLAAIEILAGYDSAKEKLGFVVDWLESNRDENGQWDFGAKAKDNVYFPLSDSWRSAEIRKADCTKRVRAVLQRLTN